MARSMLVSIRQHRRIHLILNEDAARTSGDEEFVSVFETKADTNAYRTTAELVPLSFVFSVDDLFDRILAQIAGVRKDDELADESERKELRTEHHEQRAQEQRRPVGERGEPQ